jgi:hypothetical protein
MTNLTARHRLSSVPGAADFLCKAWSRHDVALEIMDLQAATR